MGGSAGLTLLLGMVRVKFAAVLIGANGVGLNTSYTAVQTVIGTIAGLGLQSSAVREIASATSNADQQAIGRTVLALRRLSWLAGLLGMIAVVVLSPMLSDFTFGHQRYASDISALGLVILFTTLTGAETALIQGTRQIDTLAKANVLSGALGTAAAVGLYATLGIEGVAPALVIASAMQLIITWYFSRRIAIPKVKLSYWQTILEARNMAQLGLIMMINGLMVSAVTYATVSLLTRQEGMAAAGIYSAAFALSGIFVNFVLSAMATDYYPRLTGLVDSKIAMTRLVNEQTEIAMLLALPGLLATLTFAPWIIKIFYSHTFLEAVKPLQWFLLGCMGRVISWPLGFVLLALGKGRWFLLTETSFNGLYMILIFLGLKYFGIEGTAMAFFVMYLGYIAAVYYVCRLLIDFTWTPECLKVASFALPTLGIVFVASRNLATLPAGALGFIATITTSFFCLRAILKRVEPDQRLGKILSRVPGISKLHQHIEPKSK